MGTINAGRVKGALWYKGTAITGVESGHFETGLYAYTNDMYLNTDNRNVYICTTGGDEDTAVWEYATNIPGGYYNYPTFNFDFDTGHLSATGAEGIVFSINSEGHLESEVL